MAAARATRGMVGILVLVIVVLAAAGVALAEDPPDYRSSFGPDGTEVTGFEFSSSLTIDQQTESVYVVDRNAGSIFKFDLEGKPVDFGGSASYLTSNELTGLAFTANVGFNQIAVNSASHTIYVTGDEGKSLVAFQQDGEPSLFTAGAGIGSNEIGGFSNLVGVAVDASGNIYASDNGLLDGEDVVKVYEASGELLTEFAVANPGNIAVDANGAVYVNRLVGNVLKFTPSEPTVTASTTYTAGSEPFDPKNSYTVSVDPLTNDVYIAHTFVDPGIAWYDESGVLLATFAKPSETGGVFSVEGLAVGAGERIFVSNVPEVGLSQVEVFGPEVIFVDRPTVRSIAATDVTSASARVVTQINPNTLATTYRIEYGLGDCALSPCTSVPVGGIEIGSGHKFVAATQLISGLQPNTTYHFRVVAENEKGDNLGSEGDHVFVTQGSSLDFRLSDSRVWELVSPPNKHGANLVSAFWGHIQASENGTGVAYLTQNSIEVDPQGNRILEPSTVLARRGEDGWNSKDLASPNVRVAPSPLGQQAEFKLFSSDLSKAILEPISGTSLSPEASERTPYLRENTDPPFYSPLVTGKEGFANVPPGTVFGGENVTPQLRLQAATSDLKHIVLVSKAPLILGAPENSLYRWAAGELEPISVLPEGDEMTDERPVIGAHRGSVRHAISEDGSRVFWSTTDGPLTGLYMRDMEAEETVRIDVNQGGGGLGKAEPEFQGASADGTIVFFTDSQQLTEDASPGGRDLYRCEIPAGESISGCSTLTDISAPADGSGEDAEVQGIVSALSEDGRALYFVAKGSLDTTPNQFGASAEPEGFNLYFWQEGQGVRFIAPLSVRDSGDWGGLEGNSIGQASVLTASGSPSGRYFTFMSELGLTGQGNEDLASGELVEEIFRYDAGEDSLQCVSCSPTGAATKGQVLPDNEVVLVDPLSQWSATGQRVAATVPGPAVIEVGGISLYRSRSVFDSGRVFFNAFDSLVPADSNGNWDVYQFEPIGTGDCVASSAGAAVVRSGEGCISLISSGAGEEEVGFADASASGDDVFFFSPARLSAIDHDQELDLYDARVNGTPDIAPVVTECAGEACQPFTGPPNDPTPASSAFEGPGNINAGKQCPKGKHKVKRKGKVRCVPKQNKSQGQKKRAGHNGRAVR